MAFNLGSIFYSLGVDLSRLSGATAVVRAFGFGVAKSQAQVNGFVGGLRNLESAAVLAVGPLSGVGARIRSLGQLLNSTSLVFAGFAAGVVGGGFALYKLGEAMTQTELRLTSTRQRLLLLKGTQAGVSADFAYLTDLAQRFGVDIVQLGSSYSKLTAATQGTNLEGDKTRQIFEKLAAVGANLSLSNEQMELSFLAVEQMISKGVVSMEELRRQLGDQIPGAFQAAARAMGVSTAKLTEMIKKGQIATDEFLPKLLNEMLKTFGIDTTKRVDTLRAAFGRLSTSWTLFSDRLNQQTGFTEKYKQALEAFGKFLDTFDFNLKKVVPIVGALGAGLLVLVSPAILTGIAALTGGLIRLALAITGINIAAAAGTPVALALRLAVMAGAAFAAVKAYQSLQGTIEETDYDPIIKQVDEYLASQESMRKSNIATTDNLIAETEKQIRINQDNLQAMKDDLNSIVDAQKNAFPKQTNAIRGFFKNYLGIDVEDTSQAKAAIEAIELALARLDGRLATLWKRRIDQAALPDDLGLDPDSVAKTEAQVRRLESALQDLEQAQGRFAAAQKGPLALQMYEDFVRVDSAVLSFKHSLEQAGVSGDELTQKVEAFKTALEGPIKLDPINKAITDLQQIVTGAFSTISDEIAKSFVEGTQSIQDFVDIGKKLLEQLISKMIELVIFNNLFNALTGATGSAALPTLSAAGLGNLFTAHAKGTVLNSPTIVGKTGKKYDVGGEAGYEGLLPLARTGSGDLGVKAIGMGTSAPAQVILDINVTNNSSKADVQAQQNDSGGVDIVVVDKMVAGAIGKRGGLTDKALSQRRRLIPRGA